MKNDDTGFRFEINDFDYITIHKIDRQDYEIFYRQGVNNSGSLILNKSELIDFHLFLKKVMRKIENHDI